MKRIKEIKQKHQAKFIKNILKKSKEVEKIQAISEVKRNIYLIQAPSSGKGKTFKLKMILSYKRKSTCKVHLRS
uniref:Uncharacterized protein n=1 Tax=Monodelphis domestica TaxID=13616 RepID=A0A5F8GYN6_MONDO